MNVVAKPPACCQWLRTHSIRRSGSSHCITSRPVFCSNQGMPFSISHACACGATAIRVVIWRSIIGTSTSSSATITSTIAANTSTTPVMRERPVASMRSTSGSPSQASASASTNGVRIGASSHTTQPIRPANRMYFRRRRNCAISASGVRFIAGGTRC